MAVNKIQYNKNHRIVLSLSTISLQDNGTKYFPVKN